MRADTELSIRHMQSRHRQKIDKLMQVYVHDWHRGWPDNEISSGAILFLASEAWMIQRKSVHDGMTQDVHANHVDEQCPKRVPRWHPLNAIGESFRCQIPIKLSTGPSESMPDGAAVILIVRGIPNSSRLAIRRCPLGTPHNFMP